MGERPGGHAGISWGRTGGALVAAGPDGERLLEEVPLEDGAMAAADARVRWYPVLGWWRFRSRIDRWRAAAAVGVSRAPVPEGWLAFSDEDDRPLLLVREVSPCFGVLKGEVRCAPGVSANRLRWRLRARPGERFLGFGERFNAVDQTGNRLFVWTEEGGIGLGEKLGPLLDGLPFNPFPNGPTTAYKPMPFFISSAGYGLLIDTTARVEYDVAATDPGVVEIEVWDGGFRWVLFYGPEPSGTVERFTAETGRARVPAPWVFTPWNDAVFGSENVRRVAEKLRSERVPTTAIWTEDWQGGYWIPSLRRRKGGYVIFPVRYRVDRSLYPDLEELAEELHRAGFRWLSYFFPYIRRGSREYRYAKKRGYLLKNRRGRPSLLLELWLTYGHIDLTNAEACDWYARFLEENVRAGFDGWMADFGEYVPPGSVASDGEPGLLHHNRFPVLWQRMHHDFFQRMRPDGDYVFFCRSAGVGSQAFVPVFWSGDSNTDFERYDGLPSNLPAVLSAGLCGLALWAADIGGYSSMTTRGRDRELYYRWTEFASMLAVMRTHHGTHPGCSWQWDTDHETIRVFRRYCRLHTALFPFLYSLAHEADRTGLPVVRHLILHYPEDRRCWQVEDQFLLGDRILVAPVVERGARARIVYFPAGVWVDYWSARTYEGPAGHTVDSPLEHIPVFIKGGSIVPTIDRDVDTLAPAAGDTGLVGLEEALGSLRLTLYGEGGDEYTVWDGTRAVMYRGEGTGDLAASSIRVEEGELIRPESDLLQPTEAREDPLLVVACSGDPIALLLENTEGMKRASGNLRGGGVRERVTFEWR